MYGLGLLGTHTWYVREGNDPHKMAGVLRHPPPCRRAPRLHEKRNAPSEAKREMQCSATAKLTMAHSVNQNALTITNLGQCPIAMKIIQQPAALGGWVRGSSKFAIVQ